MYWQEWLQFIWTDDKINNSHGTLATHLITCNSFELMSKWTIHEYYEHGQCIKTTAQTVTVQLVVKHTLILRCPKYNGESKSLNLCIMVMWFSAQLHNYLNRISITNYNGDFNVLKLLCILARKIIQYFITKYNQQGLHSKIQVLLQQVAVSPV